MAWLAPGSCSPLTESQNNVNLNLARSSPSTGLSAASSDTTTFQAGARVRGINTGLAGLVVLLSMGTYWLLIIYATPLSDRIILPSRLLEDNIAALLSATWLRVQKYTSEQYEKDKEYGLALFHKEPIHNIYDVDEEGKVITTKLSESYILGLGFEDVKKQADDQLTGTNFMASVKVSSPVMKNLVQIAVWNSVSFWLVFVMVVNTVMLDGFISGNIVTESWLCLTLVTLYAAANFGHQYRTSILLYKNFTIVVFQACWRIVCKEFTMLSFFDYHGWANGDADRKALVSREGSDVVWTSFDLDLFGAAQLSNTYRFVNPTSDRMASYEEGRGFQILPADFVRKRCILKKRDKAESNVEKVLKADWEAEIKSLEKATESGLDRVLFNVVVMLGICLATGLTPWTSYRSTDATSAQLGSYALLLSISTGIVALLGSITHLTNATQSAERLLLLQQATIRAEYRTHSSDEPRVLGPGRPQLSFLHDIRGRSQVTQWGLWRLAALREKLLWILFGSALILVPRFFPDCRKDDTLYFKLEDFLFGYSDGTKVFRAVPRGHHDLQHVAGLELDVMKPYRGEYNDGIDTGHSQESPDIHEASQTS